MSGSLRLFCKTISYGILHFGVAFAVAYALTQNLVLAAGIGMIEPVIQMLVYCLHELAWGADSAGNLCLT